MPFSNLEMKIISISKISTLNTKVCNWSLWLLRRLKICMRMRSKFTGLNTKKNWKNITNTKRIREKSENNNLELFKCKMNFRNLSLTMYSIMGIKSKILKFDSINPIQSSILLNYILINNFLLISHQFFKYSTKLLIWCINLLIIHHIFLFL